MLVLKISHLLKALMLFAIFLCVSVCSVSGVWADHCPKIVEKKQWGGRVAATVEYTLVPVDYVVVHHTVTPECLSQDSCSNTLKSIQNFHIDEMEFHDIGYNFLVGGDGKVYEGVGWYKVGAHTRGYNTKSIGLAFIGDFSKNHPEQAQLEAAKEFIKCAVEMGALSENYKLFGAKKITYYLLKMDVNPFIKTQIEYSGKEGPIRCIFFCEFHPTAGPIISCQVPENYISKELFDSISVYIITKAELQKSTITVTLKDHKILGFPVRIDDNKYARNAYHFNLCFVCDSDARTVQYESVVTKLTDYLIGMEVDSSFLSGGNTSFKLTPILKQVMDELNVKGECALTEGPTATHLKVCRIRLDPSPVMDHQVPVFIKELPEQQWDLTTQQVTPYIDGLNHVARIAALSDVDNNLVKACVQNLVYYEIVAMVPLFQYGNVYCTTPKLKMLAQDLELQRRCLHYVAKSKRQLPMLRDVFRMYAAMTRGTTIRDLCIRFNPPNLRINERKLVQFGVLEQIIRRVHKFPVILGENPDLQKTFSGSCSLDEICCSSGVTTQQLEDQLERDHNVMMLWK